MDLKVITSLIKNQELHLLVFLCQHGHIIISFLFNVIIPRLNIISILILLLASLDRFAGLLYAPEGRA